MGSHAFRRVLLISIIPLVKAYTTFETTCSAPSSHSGSVFVSAPDARGTLDILWSSLFTILACTWTLQHPNVPDQRNGRRPGRLGDVASMLGNLLLSACWMILTVLAPEYIISKACQELINAREVQQKMREFVRQDEVAWTLTHSYYAKMGGFAIRIKPHANIHAGSARQETLHCLSAEQVYELRRTEVIESLPNIALEEIMDKSKGAALSKTIAVGQALWATVQIIVRAARNLPVSPLEVAAVAFAACAVIIYGLYWHKPQRISTPIVILNYAHGPEETLEEILRACYETKANQTSLERTKPPQVTVTAAARSRPVSSRDAQPGDWRSVAAGAIGATVFGAIHVAAWNFAFPTRLELIWWRCASVYTAAIPLGLAASVLVGYGTLQLCGISDRVRKLMVYLLVGFSMCLYMAARYFILVEIVRTLFLLPAGSFVSTWASNVPHVG